MCSFKGLVSIAFCRDSVTHAVSSPSTNRIFINKRQQSAKNRNELQHLDVKEKRSAIVCSGGTVASVVYNVGFAGFSAQMLLHQRGFFFSFFFLFTLGRYWHRQVSSQLSLRHALYMCSSQTDERKMVGERDESMRGKKEEGKKRARK